MSSDRDERGLFLPGNTVTYLATAYDPAYCERVIEYGRLGKSLTWMAAEFGVTRKTIYNWENAHPEFAEALEIARTQAQRWWEDAGQTGMLTQGFNGPVWSRSIGARFPADWREIRGNEVSGPGGGPVQVQEVRRVIVDPANSDS